MCSCPLKGIAGYGARVSAMALGLTMRLGKTDGVAVAAMAGWPPNTMTRSARYVAMMKSCSITNAVFFA